MKDIWAYVHIHKCAGTTIKHMFLKDLPFFAIEGRCLFPHENGVMSIKSLNILNKINPFFKLVWGHAVRPSKELISRQNIKFITVLRDPMKRYLSHYYHTREALMYNWSFSDFLKQKTYWNYQTKYIAGIEDADAAIEIVQQRFELVGLVEEFDEFLSLMKLMLNPLRLNLNYFLKGSRSNKKLKRTATDINLQDWKSEIMKRNDQDKKLYSYVQNVFLPEIKNKYRNSYDSHFELQTSSPSRYPLESVSVLTGHILRKGFYLPLIGLLRKKNGLTYGGWK